MANLNEINKASKPEPVKDPLADRICDTEGQIACWLSLESMYIFTTSTQDMNLISMTN
jgi:hypothetical protein